MSDLENDSQTPEEAPEETYTEAGEPEAFKRSPAWVNWVLILVVVGGMFLVFGVGRPLLNRWTLSDPSTHLAVGSPLFRVELAGLVGAEDSINLEQLRDQVVLINFWAAWCEPCRAEMPHIAQIHDDFSGVKGFRLLSVAHGAADTLDEKAELRRETAIFLTENGIEMPIYCDPGGSTLNAFDELATQDGKSKPSVVPTTLLLDRKGIIRAVWIGFAPNLGIEEQMRTKVADLLQKSIPAADASP